MNPLASVERCIGGDDPLSVLPLLLQRKIAATSEWQHFASEFARLRYLRPDHTARQFPGGLETVTARLACGGASAKSFTVYMTHDAAGSQRSIQPQSPFVLVFIALPWPQPCFARCMFSVTYTDGQRPLWTLLTFTMTTTNTAPVLDMSASQTTSTSTSSNYYGAYMR
jgi:hypothetical protein